MIACMCTCACVCGHTYICQYSRLLVRFCSPALAVYVRSPAAYEALKSFKLLQLPSKTTLQAYTGAFLDDPGICVLGLYYPP